MNYLHLPPLLKPQIGRQQNMDLRMLGMVKLQRLFI